MSVSRLLNLLILFALVVTNGPAIAMAKCQHQDARAHAAALESQDKSHRALAMSEETAAQATSDKASLGDAATTLLAGYMLPGNPLSLEDRVLEAIIRHAARASHPGSRTVPPLLEPPLA